MQLLSANLLPYEDSIGTPLDNEFFKINWNFSLKKMDNLILIPKIGDVWFIKVLSPNYP